tara:strand:- start:1359 stop:2105 length:747 start_codon:yes stop_codon:yes gene_type:complete
MNKIQDRLHIYLSKNPRVGFFLYELVRKLKKFKNKDGLDNFYRLKKLGYKPKSIFDVGANRGEWSNNLKEIFKDANFFLFEPQIEMEPFLKRFTDNNPGSEYFLLALGEKEKVEEIGIWPGYYGTTFLHQNLDLEKREINVQSINNLIQNNRIPIPDVLKMDVQGFEMNILNGATQCFKHTEIIILETYLYSFLHNQPIFSEIVNFMYDNGYVIFDFEPFNRHKKTKILRYFDTIFIKKDSDIRKLAS